MKICDLTQFYSPVSGGVKRYITEKRRHIERHTQDEHYLIIPGHETRHTQEGRLHTYTIQAPQLNPTSRYRLLLNTHRVRDFLDDVRPDVIEAGDPYHVAWTALRSGRELHIPVFGFYHSHFPEAYLRTVLKYGGRWVRDAVLEFAQRYITSLYSRFHATLVPSDLLRDLLLRWGVTNATTVHLGVDTESFRPGERDDALRAELGLPRDALVLLYVGRLAPEKNIVTLLRAFELVREQSKRDVRLVLVGDGPLRRKLPAVRRATGALTWKSYLQGNEDLARYYRAADLFVHPGVHETFGLVALEAQACGIPVAGIHGSYMDANVFAGGDYWARENTPAALARTILAMSEADLPAMGRAASAIVRERYAWPVVLEVLWRHYRQAHELASHPVYYGKPWEVPS
ncbi:MAG: glycosyltransferase [Verrucomicrobiota bacterium]